ncbi:MAG: dipeptide epimerase [Fibrobacteria bacterium]|nr:dipeptide epimerase [Fibrobacteria bacterium]
MRVFTQELEPKVPFRIARGTKHYVENVFVELRHAGITAYGEASPNRFYGETAKQVKEKLGSVKSALSNLSINSPTDIKDHWKASWEYLAPSRAAQCALDLALWDLLGKKKDESVSRLLWNEPAHALTTSCTLGICEENEWPARIAEIKDFPIIKIKMGSPSDFPFLEYIRSQTNARLWVDANCAWQAEEISEVLRQLHAQNVEMVEQPLPPAEDNAMSAILQLSPLPVIADESCKIISDVEGLHGRFSGINIKLVKCGGITPALEMIKLARRAGLQVMTGCMLETNLLIAAGLAIAQKADYVDLDGSWLLKESLFEGVVFNKGELSLCNRSGLGVSTTGMYDN